MSTSFLQEDIESLQEGTADENRGRLSLFFPQSRFLGLRSNSAYASYHEETNSLALRLKAVGEGEICSLLTSFTLTRRPETFLRLTPVDGVSIWLPQSFLKSCSSSILADLPEAKSLCTGTSPSPALDVLRIAIAEFAQEQGKLLSVKALELYACYLQTKLFDSRLFLQYDSGYYVIDFQLACIALGWIVRDGDFAFLAKMGMFHAWLDDDDKIRAINLKAIQKIFQMMPFTEDFLSTYRHRMVNAPGRKVQANDTEYDKSLHSVHPVSWLQIRVYDIFKQAAVTAGLGHRPKYRRTLELLRDSVDTSEDGKTNTSPIESADTINELEKNDPASDAVLNSDAPAEQDLSHGFDAIDVRPNLGRVIVSTTPEDAEPTKAAEIKRVLLKTFKRKSYRLESPASGSMSTPQDKPDHPRKPSKTGNSLPVLTLADAQYRASARSPPLIIDEDTGVRYKLIQDSLHHNLFIPRNGKAPIHWSYTEDI